GLTSHHTPFSFLLSSPHLALHSFPTRRSSDLTSKGILAGVPATSTAHRQRLEIDGTPFLFQHGYRFGKVTYITRLPLGKNMTVLDRKSTRLNSSHLVISYAVFCLKKKKILIHY